MHEETRASLKQGILTCLPTLREAAGRHSTEHLVWSKREGVGWSAETRMMPDMTMAFGVCNPQIEAAAAPFLSSFSERHPDHVGMVGFRGAQFNWAMNLPLVFGNMLGALRGRHGTFDLAEGQVDEVVQEFSDFVDAKAVRLRFQARLINLIMEGDSIQLPRGPRIRRLSEREVNGYHGGPLRTLGFGRPWPVGMDEFVAEGEFDEPKILGKDDDPGGETMMGKAKAAIDQVVLCLRTFKEGPVGYDFVDYRSETFCPVGLPSHGCGDKHVPFGTYSIEPVDVAPLLSHAGLLASQRELAMQMACTRLADAENRFRPHDRVVDAVIGMEALLLAGLGKEDRKGELSFRFSLNHAMLSKTPEERKRAFRTARDLYGLRSVIAHGSNFDETEIRVGATKMSLEEAGKAATRSLRAVIMYFLSLGGTPYKDHEFWQNAYFGFPDAR